MPTDALKRLRKICLALPEATEVEAWGAPTFRCGKIFAVYGAAGDQKHNDGRECVWLKAGPGQAALMIADRPTRFFRPPYVGGAGWVGVWLDKRPPWKEVAVLVRESWELTAPARVKRTMKP